MNNDILILENQIVIMLGLLCDPNINSIVRDELKQQITITRNKLRTLR